MNMLSNSDYFIEKHEHSSLLFEVFYVFFFENISIDSQGPSECVKRIFGYKILSEYVFRVHISHHR